MNRSPHQSRDHEPAGVGVPPSIPFVAMPGPLNRLVHTTPPITPALGAFIGPKQYNATVVWEMASTACTCHWVSTAPDGIGTTDVALPPPQAPSQVKLALYKNEAVQLGLQHTSVAILAQVLPAA